MQPWMYQPVTNSQSSTNKYKIFSSISNAFDIKNGDAY